MSLGIAAETCLELPPLLSFMPRQPSFSASFFDSFLCPCYFWLFLFPSLPWMKMLSLHRVLFLVLYFFLFFLHILPGPYYFLLWLPPPLDNVGFLNPQLWPVLGTSYFQKMIRHLSVCLPHGRSKNELFISSFLSKTDFFSCVLYHAYFHCWIIQARILSGFLVNFHLVRCSSQAPRWPPIYPHLLLFESFYGPLQQCIIVGLSDQRIH